MSIVFKSLTENQKLLIDIWVSKNINSSFITPAIMQQIQEFKTMRINEMYREYKDQGLLVNQKSIADAVSGTWNSLVNVLPYLLIIIVCIVMAVFIGRFYRNIGRITQLGKTQD